MKAGASSATVNILPGGASVVIAFPTDKAEIPDDSNNSFDKIMPEAVTKVRLKYLHCFNATATVSRIIISATVVSGGRSRPPALWALQRPTMRS
jgi:hypothetical protein